MPTTTPHPESSEAVAAKQYVVVARRYRPQGFSELIGQEHVAQALSNAISTHRVGHAYLLTGARGVGKTSTARILAKALNCEKGPTPTPCNECDICKSITSGEDVDVLEIDGASNRGIDEIRQLRQNVNVRPSRSRYKIYIIDEVHMLTREAFNALLKTLEEPPEHVKFIFCTTEATKIPITILSRCQRFDFAGILTGSIRERLQQIVNAEGVEAEPEALEVIARRAAGSMRDSQSLLEQLLAFSPGKITLTEVHGMLGTAGDERLSGLANCLVKHDAAGALAEFDAAMNAGVDAAQLVEQLFGYFRDCMAASVGCSNDSFLYTSPANASLVVENGQQLGLNTILAAMQILDQSLSRMRYSTQGRIIAELAIVRISHLENLDELSELIAMVQSGAPVISGSRPALASPASPASQGSATSSLSEAAGFAAKKKFEPPLASRPSQTPSQASSQPSGEPSQSGGESSPSTGSTFSHDNGDPSPSVASSASSVPSASPSTPRIEFTQANAESIWTETLAQMSGMVVEQAKLYDSVELTPPNRLVVRFSEEFPKSMCERQEQVVRFEKILAEIAGTKIRVEFVLCEKPAKPSQAVAKPKQVKPASQHQRKLEVINHPMIQKAIELFGAQVESVKDPSPRG
jgi:DNA polymerase-3 subunit gamma/tau